MKKKKKTKERSYGFLTTESTIIEVKATNAKTAFRKAQKNLKN